MKFRMKGFRNHFKSGSSRGRGSRRGFPNQRGFPREWISPNQNLIPLGKFAYSCQGEAVCKAEIENVPYFNAPIYRDNRQQIGKINEIFGNPRDYMVTIKLDEGIKATSFPLGETFFIDSMKLLPLSRFLPKPRGPGTKKWIPKFARSTKNKETASKKRTGSFFRK